MTARAQDPEASETKDYPQGSVTSSMIQSAGQPVFLVFKVDVRESFESRWIHISWAPTAEGEKGRKLTGWPCLLAAFGGRI